MNRNLILIRHTKSSWSNPDMPDFDRPIKKDRQQDAIDMGKLLHGMKLNPDLIIASPSLRTKQTTTLICKELGYDLNRVKWEKGLYESDVKDYLEEIRFVDESVKTLVVVGHNPVLTDLANLFADQHIDSLPTTGTVWLRFVCNDWDLDKTVPCETVCYLKPSKDE